MNLAKAIADMELTVLFDINLIPSSQKWEAQRWALRGRSDYVTDCLAHDDVTLCEFF